jgi:hypothetical protein
MAKNTKDIARQSEQIAEGNTVQGRLVQSNDADKSIQSARNNSAEEIRQNVASKQSQLRAFGISGTGLYAVIGVIIIAVALLIVKYVSH